MAYTFLRDNVYADLFRYLAGDDGVLRGPAGQGWVAGPFSVRDPTQAYALLRRGESTADARRDLTAAGVSYDV